MITVIVKLWASGGDLARLRLFEQQALTLVAKYEGQLIAAFRPKGGEEAPDEIHVLQFPTEENWQTFLMAPERALMEEERKQAIQKTEIDIGEQDVLHVYTA